MLRISSRIRGNNILLVFVEYLINNIQSISKLKNTNKSQNPSMTNVINSFIKTILSIARRIILAMTT